MFNKHHSKISKEKIGASKKGKPTWMKDKHHTKKSKEKISISKMKLSIDAKKEIYQFIISRQSGYSIESAIKPLICKFNVSRNTIYRAYNYISSSSF